MDRDDDVERLFSWIKTPDLHYREFADERDVADGVATWPVPRQNLPEAAYPEDRPEAASEHEPPPPGPPPLGGHLTSMFGHRDRVPEPPAAAEPHAPAPHEPAGEVPWAPEPPRPSPIFARLEPTAPPRRPTPEPPPEPGSNREYHGFEEERQDPAAAVPADQGEGRSLDAIFSRLAHSPRTQRDDPKRATGGAGLGSVFRRLR